MWTLRAARLILAGVAGGFLFGLPVHAQEQMAPSSTRPNPSAYRPSSSDSSSTDVVYDISDASARSAFAHEQLNRIEGDLSRSIAYLRLQFENSGDYRNAVKERDQAQLAYDDVRRPIDQAVEHDPGYQRLAIKRDRVSAVLDDHNLSAQDRYELAARKLDYASLASSIRAEALWRDNDVKGARDRLIAAQQHIDQMRKDFQLSLYKNSEVMSAIRARDAAKVNVAAADGYLAGAVVARNDMVYYNELRFGLYRPGGGVSAVCAYYPGSGAYGYGGGFPF